MKPYRLTTERKLREDIARGIQAGTRRGGDPVNKAEHFYKCAECGGWVDMRDLGSVFAHEPDGTHPKADKPQH